jgi:hypothetical protein
VAFCENKTAYSQVKTAFGQSVMVFGWLEAVIYHFFTTFATR